MKFIDLIKLATRMFKSRTSRTLLTIFGIGIGMSVILFLVSLGFGVQKIVLNRITTSDSLASMDVFSNPEKGREISWQSVEQIGQMKEVEKVIPSIKYEGQIKFDDYSTIGDFILTRPGYVSMDAKKITDGRDLLEGEKNRGGVLLSSTFLKILSKDSKDLLGDQIEIILNIPKEKQGQFNEQKLNQEFFVSGIVEDTKSLIYLNLDELDDSAIGSSIFSLKVKTKDPNQVDLVKDKINALGYETSSISEVVDQTRKFFSITSLSLAILGIVALIVSSIGMFNTMIITLLERTEEIGIMKAIGATNKNILNIFIVESGLIGFLGGVAGILIGFSAEFFVNSIVNFIAIRMGGGQYDLFDSPTWFVFLLVAMSFLIGIATGWIPARKASVVDPLEALRKR